MTTTTTRTTKVKEAAAEFLAQKRVAVTGVSRKPQGHGGNIVYQRYVWMHRSFGPGSVSSAGAACGRERGIHVIDGGCPLMFGPTADFGHKAIRFVCTLAGTVPRRV